MSLYLGENLISGQATLVGESRNIGQIIPSTIPLTDAGLHLLDGALIQGSGIYSAFVDYIAGLVSTYPDLFCTEANWQQAVTNYGVCGKFVYDSVNNTVRLPKISDILEGTTDVTAIGDLVQAGLPNITGSFDKISGSNALLNAVTSEISRSGALYISSYSNTGWLSGSGSGNVVRGLGFDASFSDSIYGNSTTVQPQTIKVLYYIVIATSTKTDIEVDIDEVVTDLNGKADVDLTNCTKPHIVETYVNGASWYRVYSDGWCEQGGISATLTGYGVSTNVTLLKEMANTNYTVTAVIYRDATGYADQFLVATAKTKLGFTVYANWAGSGNYSQGQQLSWQVEGYIS